MWDLDRGGRSEGTGGPGWGQASASWAAWPLEAGRRVLSCMGGERSSGPLCRFPGFGGVPLCRKGRSSSESRVLGGLLERALQSDNSLGGLPWAGSKQPCQLTPCSLGRA